MPPPRSSRQTLAVTVVRAGARRFELRDHRGVVLDSVDSRLAARDLVSALKRQCGPGWRIEVTWVGCEAP